MLKLTNNEDRPVKVKQKDFFKIKTCNNSAILEYNKIDSIETSKKVFFHNYYISFVSFVY